MKIPEEIVEKFRTSAAAFGAMYILPDGTTLDLSLLENGHTTFFGIAGCTAADLKEAGWIRLNTKVKYIELPTRPITESQSAVLSEVIAFMGDDYQIR